MTSPTSSLNSSLAACLKTCARCPSELALSWRLTSSSRSPNLLRRREETGIKSNPHGFDPRWPREE